MAQGQCPICCQHQASSWPLYHVQRPPHHTPRWGSSCKFGVAFSPTHCICLLIPRQMCHWSSFVRHVLLFCQSNFGPNSSLDYSWKIPSGCPHASKGAGWRGRSCPSFSAQSKPHGPYWESIRLPWYPNFGPLQTCLSFLLLTWKLTDFAIL